MVMQAQRDVKPGYSLPIALATIAPMKQTPTTVTTATSGGQVMVTTMTPANSEITMVTSWFTEFSLEY